MYSKAFCASGAHQPNKTVMKNVMMMMMIIIIIIVIVIINY
jgi:hypothetical protein